MMSFRIGFISVLLLLLSLSTHAQKRVKVKADDQYGSIKDGMRFDRLVGNVVFTQNNIIIYCDSAHFFKQQNRIEAFGRVHIVEGDSVDVTSRGLSYNGTTRVAYLRKNVIFKKLGTATLYTDFLDYYRDQRLAKYFNGGKLVDSTNTLTSEKGYYDANTDLASFKKNVVAVNPEYTLNSDTLQYNSKTKIIYFKDSTTVKDKDGGVANYTSGFYNTLEKQSALNKGEIETPTYKMKGDQNFIDDARKFYRTKGNVVMVSKEENMIIYGDDGFYDKAKGISKIYNRSYVAKIGEDKDTLFIAADTLVSIESQDPKKKRLLAYKNVRIFKTDLQGKADSLAYFNADSTLFFYNKPVLWTNENQMTADSIRILLKNKTIHKIYMTGNSFVVSEDSLKNFNQIKGRKMTANFSGKQISHVVVEGNGESIYYALEQKLQKVDSVSAKKYSVTAGMNKIICSNMRINFIKGKVNNISFYVKPDASFIPPHELKEEDKRLRGFVWRKSERPNRKSVVTP